MKRRIPFVSLIILGFIQVDAQVPTITSFSPQSGPIGTSVTITGTNFDPAPANNIVYFGATKAIVGSANSTQIVVTAPAGATYQPITVTVNGLTSYSNNHFNVTFSSNGIIDGASFASKIDFTAGVNASVGTTSNAVAIADFNLDGKPDVVLVSPGADKITVFRSTSVTGSISATSFVSGIDFAVGINPRGVEVGDVDGDGKQDMVIINNGNFSISVLHNTTAAGSISFGRYDYSTDANPESIAIGDIDGDGRPEIVVTTQGPTLSVYRNTSTPGIINASSLAARVNFTVFNISYGVAITDIDGDSKKDIVTSSTSPNNFISVYRNTSVQGVIDINSLASRVNFATGLDPLGMGVADFDGDGKMDVVTANYSANNISIFRNLSTTGAISFDAPANFSISNGPWGIVFSDFDGDGRPDLAATQFSSVVVSVMRNISTPGPILAGSLGTNIDFATLSGPYSVTSGDIDLDGRPELIVANNIANNTISVFHNVITPLAEPTVQASNLIIQQPFTNTLSLTWTNGNGASRLVVGKEGGTVTESPVDGMTYSASSSFSSGTSLGGNYVVYKGSGSSVAVTAIQPGTNYQFFVFEYNGTAGSENYLTSTATGNPASFTTGSADTTPPVVASNSTPTTIAPNTDLIVTANFTDAGSGVDYAGIEYRPIAGVAPNNFITRDMVNTSGSAFKYTIPANEVTELGIEYRFLLRDFVPNDNSLDQTHYRTRIAHAAGLPIPYASPGRAIANYQIIAVPLELESKSMNSVLGDELGAYDPTKWIMYRYDGTRFVELSGTTQLEMGKGYWLLTPNAAPLNSGPGNSADVGVISPFQITLNPGWNQIGNPYNFDISWQDILDANPTVASSLSVKIRVFRGNKGDDDKLNAFEGGFVSNSGSTVDIDIPVEKNMGIQGGRKGDTQKVFTALDQPNWEILFNLKQGDTEYKLGGLGMHPNANLGFDYFDDYNSPRFIEYLEIKFPKQRVGMTYTKDIVPTSENFVWEFSVESNINATEISISWDNSYFGNVKEIYLLDVAEHRMVDMNAQESYQFAATASKQFKVIYGNPDFVKDALIPDRIVLYDPYPNPFIDQVAIAYSLPKESVTINAEIGIYNGLGVNLSRVSAPREAGAGNWTWLSEGNPSGLYFVRIRLGDQVVTKKLLKR